MTARRTLLIERIVSGGQTGVDRGALDAALRAGVPVGGWCPRGRRAEDGVIPTVYPLQETPSTSYTERTRRNVIDSDGTLILNSGCALTGGTAFTKTVAEQTGKPHLVVDFKADTDPLSIVAWLEGANIEILNVAGPRESQNPGIQDLADRFVSDVLSLFEQEKRRR